MSISGPQASRRERLQSRLEEAVGRGEITIAEYEDLCAVVWSGGGAGNGGHGGGHGGDDLYPDDTPELDAVAGRLERIEERRPQESPGNPYRATHAGGGRVPARTDGRHGLARDEDRQAGTPTIFSDKKIGGRWAPKADTTWWGLFGDVKLDLREADWPGNRIVLDFQSAFSEASIIVPPGTCVIDETTAILGEVKITASGTAPANGLTVVLDGILMFSEVKVKDA